MHHLLGVPRVIALGALVPVAPDFAVNRLIGMLGADDEDTSMAAYMVLVKVGPKAATNLLQAARGGRHTTKVIQVIGDLGDPSLISDLEEFLSDENSEVVNAAAESISALRQD